MKYPIIMYVIVVAKVDARTSNANTNHLLTNLELTTTCDKCLNESHLTGSCPE